jgi:hypothetical protein
VREMGYPAAIGGSDFSDFEDHGHNHRPSPGGFLDQPLQLGADFFLDHAVVGFLLDGQGVEGLQDRLTRLLRDVGAAKAAHDHFRLLLHFAGALVDGQHRQHDAVFRQNATILNHQVFDHIDGRAGIDEHAAGGDFVFLAGVAFVQFQNVAVFNDDGVLDGAGFHGQAGVAHQVAVVAVHRNEVFGANQVDEQALLFLRAVAADVNQSVGSVVADDVGATAVEVIDDAKDPLFIAGNNARAEDDGVPGVDVGVLVVVDGGPRQRAHGFTLSAADKDHQLLGVEVAHLAGVDNQAGGNVDVAQVLGNLSGLHHGAADDGDFAVVLARQIEGDLDAKDGGREAGEEELLLGLREDFVEAGNDGAFAGRVAGALNIGRVLQQGEDAALAVLGEGVQIEGVVIERGKIDFEVAGVDDDADWRLDGQGHAIDQRMRDADGLDDERPEGEFALGLDLDELDFVEQLVLVELAFDVGQGKLGAVDGNFEFGENPGQAADVVLVAVSEDDAADAGFVLNQVGDVGHDDVYAQELGFGKHEAGVDDDNVVFPAQGEAVHAEFAKSAERDDFKILRLHWSPLMVPPPPATCGGADGLAFDSFCPSWRTPVAQDDRVNVSRRSG